MATLPNTWHYRVSARTGGPIASILFLGSLQSISFAGIYSVVYCHFLYGYAFLRIDALHCIILFAFQLDTAALRKYAMLMSQMEEGRGLASPYMIPQVPLPPRPPSSGRTPRSTRRVQSASPRRVVTTDVSERSRGWWVCVWWGEGGGMPRPPPSGRTPRSTRRVQSASPRRVATTDVSERSRGWWVCVWWGGGGRGEGCQDRPLAAELPEALGEFRVPHPDKLLLLM